MSDSKTREFERHRSLENDYWDALNDQMYGGCIKAERMMDSDIKDKGSIKHQEYTAWKTSIEKQETRDKNMYTFIHQLHDNLR